MIPSKIAAILGFAFTPVPSRQDIDRALRHARAAAFQHRKLSSNAQADSLDRIERHVADPNAHGVAQAAQRLARSTSGQGDVRAALDDLTQRLMS